jgi:hypothetical protein
LGKIAEQLVAARLLRDPSLAARPAPVLELLGVEFGRDGHWFILLHRRD